MFGEREKHKVELRDRFVSLSVAFRNRMRAGVFETNNAHSLFCRDHFSIKLILFSFFSISFCRLFFAPKQLDSKLVAAQQHRHLQARPHKHAIWTSTARMTRDII